MADQQYSFLGVDPIVVTSDKKIVLALRGEDAGAEVGRWHIPGALVQVHETLEQALQRAVKEKTNLDVVLFGSLHDSFVKMYDDVHREPRYRDVALSFLCRVVDGEMVPGARMAEVRAFAPAELITLPMGFDHKKIVLDAVDALTLRGYW